MECTELIREMGIKYEDSPQDERYIEENIMNCGSKEFVYEKF